MISDAFWTGQRDIAKLLVVLYRLGVMSYEEIDRVAWAYMEICREVRKAKEAEDE